MSDEVIRIDVRSEIGRLRHVLVHRPGDEVVRMTQHDLTQLLFDDIIAPDLAVQEHDLMTEILRGAGARVVQMRELLTQALERAPRAARLELLCDVCQLAGCTLLSETLLAMPPDRLARALIEGVDYDNLPGAPQSLVRIRRELDEGPRSVALHPVPNLMFMRDPCVAVGDHVMVGRMATLARAREPLLVAFALEHAGAVETPSFLLDEDDGGRQLAHRSLEGGDVLVLSERTLLVGCSERSSAQTIERVSRDALFEQMPSLERVYVAMMPHARSVMHLDTILTQVDRALFVGHAPSLQGDDALPVARIERDRPAKLVPGASVMDVLARELGPETALIPCGGDDPLHQEREQWTDGANALAVSPGHIILYARNVHTIAALAEHGFVQVELHSVLTPAQRAERIREGMAAPRAVFSFSGSELSRARGGGRCLTMPLARDPCPP